MASLSTPIPILSGEFRHSLDDKNRITIPSCWRGGEALELFVLPGQSQACLMVMTPEVLQKIGEESAAHAGSKQNHRKFLRHFYSIARNCSTDRQGRLLLPDDYCRQLKLTGEVVLVGGFDRIEIWSPREWKKAQEEQQPIVANVAAEMGL